MPFELQKIPKKNVSPSNEIVRTARRSIQSKKELQNIGQMLLGNQDDVRTKSIDFDHEARSMLMERQSSGVYKLANTDFLAQRQSQ